MGRDRKYRSVRIPKFRLKSKYPNEQPPKRTRIIISNRMVPFRTVKEATKDIIDQKRKMKKRTK